MVIHACKVLAFACPMTEVYDFIRAKPKNAAVFREVEDKEDVTPYGEGLKDYYY